MIIKKFCRQKKCAIQMQGNTERQRMGKCLGSSGYTNIQGKELMLTESRICLFLTFIPLVQGDQCSFLNSAFLKIKRAEFNVMISSVKQVQHINTVSTVTKNVRSGFWSHRPSLFPSTVAFKSSYSFV